MQLLSVSVVVMDALPQVQVAKTLATAAVTEAKKRWNAEHQQALLGGDGAAEVVQALGSRAVALGGRVEDALEAAQAEAHYTPSAVLLLMSVGVTVARHDRSSYQCGTFTI